MLCYINWGLNSIFMQIPPFLSLCKYGFWSHEQTHSTDKEIIIIKLKFLYFLYTNEFC